MRMFRRANIVTGVLLIASLAVLTGTALFTFNIQVLRDWHINYPPGPIHAGDTIVISSTYTKLRPVTGTASRYLNCQNKSGAYVKYKLSTAVADNKPGHNTGTGIVVIIPSVFGPLTPLPADCFFSINIRYQVYPWRAVTEFNTTSHFQLLPKSSGGSAVGGQSTTQTNQPLAVVQSQPRSTGKAAVNMSSSDTNTSSPQAQPNSVQSGPASSQPPTPEPAPTPTTLDGLPLVGGVFKFLGL